MDKIGTNGGTSFKSANAVAAVRSERGYSANIYHHSPVSPPKTMQCQFRRMYVHKKVGNSYWRWPERNLAGNPIDFHIQVLGMSFHDAMQHLTQS